ncbi:MAG: hypothetical protein LUI12_01835 [Clostridiales bacterium]|nr:hypothetical protein [Clostridiales bacterium]
MALAGVSTLGILFGYAVETTAGTKPAAFNLLTRINNVAGISLETEQIDASALEDLVTRYVAGRQDTGGTWSVTVNITDDTIAEWTSLISASTTAEEDGLSTWFEVWSPYHEKAFYVVAQPPKEIPMPELAQNELETVEMTLTINEYKGMDTAIKPGN